MLTLVVQGITVVVHVLLIGALDRVHGIQVICTSVQMGCVICPVTAVRLEAEPSTVWLIAIVAVQGALARPVCVCVGLGLSSCTDEQQSLTCSW